MSKEQRAFMTPSTGKLWAALKPLARQKRHEPTPAENALWQRLRKRQVGGMKFRRQHAIERFIVDFYCSEAHLVIEVDGSIHDYTVEEDAIRQVYLERLGLRVIRFSNDDVLQDMDGVIEMLLETLQTDTSSVDEYSDENSSPSPSHGEGARG